MSIQALREQRAAKAKAVHELANKEKWDAAVDQPIYDAGMAEIDDLDARIKRIQDSNEKLASAAVEGYLIEASQRADRDKGVPEASRLFRNWLKDGDAGITAAEWQTIRNTMSTTTPAEGGYTVPQGWATTVLDALKAYGGMRAVAEIIRTSGVGQLNYPTSDGTAEVGEILAENASATSADVSFNTKPLVAYKYSSKIVTVPFELLQDSAVDIEAFVAGRLTTRLGRITNTHFTVGTGTSQPTGVVTAATTGVTAATGNTTTTTYDAIIDLIHSIDPAYRSAGNNKFMMHDSSVKAIRKIKDGQSRPLFSPGWDVPPNGVAWTAPDTLCGYPIVVNQDMPVMAANAKSIAFGNFSYYKIRDVMDMQLFRFADSPYISKGQIGFLAWMRSGGNLVDVGGAVKLHVNSAT